MPGLDWAVFIIDPAANLQWSSGTKADNSRRQQAATLGRDEIMLQRGRISNVASIPVIPAVEGKIELLEKFWMRFANIRAAAWWSLVALIRPWQ